ncbi:putative tRNA (guanine(46)-N(7))-methyltransferase [Medicago truncatula]|uniref:Putative tRNA (Guanine(46)-N(7))-methyltransferase n=1 Tax=Medicago truncatula TaxID=3880 RepID=G7J2W8_MEDTR|nr:hypothetical protein MTR_3g109370 [Medicago truncatula]RHN70795.1 putative tRNA (guanine(46)-N(7))-methyltransferase [Medicago truncatula]
MIPTTFSFIEVNIKFPQFVLFFASPLGRGLLSITDVEELGDWMKSCLENHPLLNF